MIQTDMQSRSSMPGPPLRALHHGLAAWIVLLMSFVVTGIAWYLSDSAVRAKAEERFRFQSDDLAAAISKRLHEYETALRGGTGLFNDAGLASRQAWYEYVAALQIDKTFPGIRGMGFSLMMPAREVASQTERIRAEGFPGFNIRPPGQRDPTSAIIYLEPFDWRNQRAFGYDMYSEPVRRAAMDLAMTTGEPALSGRVTLVQETQRDVQYGFLMYVPVYRKGMPLNTAEQRRAAILGFVYSPFRMGDLMDGILGQEKGRLGFEVFDGDHPSADTLLYDHSAKARDNGLDVLAGLKSGRPARAMRLQIAQRNWTLYIHTQDDYLSAGEELLPTVVGGLGVVVDLFLFMIIHSLGRQKRLIESSEEQFRLLFERSPLAIQIYGPDGRTLGVNAAWDRLWGTPGEGAQAAGGFRDPLFEAGGFGALAARVAAEGLLEFPLREFARRSAPGENEAAAAETLWIRAFAYPVHDRDGNVKEVVVVYEDVTERQNAIRALRESRERFRDMVDSTDGIVWEADARTFEFTYVSSKAEQMLGFTVDEWRQPGFWVAHLHPEDKLWAPQHCATCNGRLESHDFEYRFIARDGRTVWLHDYVAVVPENGAPRWLRGVMVDVTQRKAAEAELDRYRHQLEELVAARTRELQAAKESLEAANQALTDNEARLIQAKEAAEAASRAKSTFLANMSHELRTPMNAIMGLTQLALRRSQDPKLMDQLGKIDQASNHLLRVINDILDLSKIEADRLVLERTRFRLGEVLAGLDSLFAQRMAEKGLKLSIEAPAELRALALEGDSTRLGQILYNLVGNAIKFTELGEIAVRVQRLASGPDQVRLRWEVEDTGIGIGPEDRAKLFNAFVQADGSMTRKYGGTGLGLAISKRLVELMGGEIGVDSLAGAGSTFWFTVCLDLAGPGDIPAEAPAPDSPEARLRARWAGTRVLLAEDEPINQEVSRDFLEDVGLIVDLAEDGAAALELARERTYGLILMDMQMPRMNGVEATLAIRALPDHARVPILAMTANAFEEDRKICLEAGMNDHIAKPIEAPVLYGTLLKWLEG